MATADLFCYVRLKGYRPECHQLYMAVRNTIDSKIVWGIFEGVFGIGSHELVVVLVGSEDRLKKTVQTIGEIDEVADLRSMNLIPTSRPQSSSPMTRAGIYVFRFLEVDNVNIETIIDLSTRGWEFFERADYYEANSLALFKQHKVSSDTSVMLIVTRYDNLASWEASRDSPPRAKELFARRRELTKGQTPLATRILTD